MVYLVMLKKYQATMREVHYQLIIMNVIRIHIKHHLNLKVQLIDVLAGISIMWLIELPIGLLMKHF